MPDTFTPEQIAQILEEFFKVVGTRQYIGARYVPIFGRKDEDTIEWDNTAPYEPLTIVLYQGNSYTSRQFVPVGVEITNQEFWAITGNYNAQVEMYRRETAAAREVADTALANAAAAQTDIDTLLPKADFSEDNTVKDYIDASVAAVQTDIDTLLPKSDFSEENTVKKYIDRNKTRVLSFDTVADMQNASYLESGMICHTNGFHASGDGGAAYYIIGANGTANGMDVLALQGELLAALVVTEPYVTPEQFGAYGDNTHDDTEALQTCINSGIPVLGAHEYLTSEKLTIATLDVHINTIHYTGTDYAVSIGNGTTNARLDIVTIVSDSGGGVILETTSTSSRLQCMLQTIRAYGAEAVYIAGGNGGVLDSTFNGSSWVGKDVGLRIAPQVEYVGNLEFNHMRINPNLNAGTGIVIDSTNGSVTQLFFNDVSLEKEASNAESNGIAIHVVHNIEHMLGNFRVVELLSGNGKVLTISGTVQQQLQQCIHFEFDRITPVRIDLSGLTMSKYYALDNPIAIIDAGNIYFADQPQTQRLVIYGNRITFKPLRRTFVNLSSDYTFDDSTWASYPYSVFFATADVTLNVPSWLELTDEIFVNPQGHTVSLKYTDWDGSIVSGKATGNNLQRVGIVRNNNLGAMFYTQ